MYKINYIDTMLKADYFENYEEAIEFLYDCFCENGLVIEGRFYNEADEVIAIIEEVNNEQRN